MTTANVESPLEAQLVAHPPEGTEKLWQEFRKPHTVVGASAPLRAQVVLTQPTRDARQFVVQTGSGHHLILDDVQGAWDPSQSNWSPWRWPGVPRST